MRKIQSQEKIKKKQKNMQMIIGFVLILVMVLSVIGFGLSGNFGTSHSNNQIEYNGYEFVNIGGLWRFNVNGQEFVTTYNPKETENISINGIIRLSDYSNKPLYFIPDEELAIKEILYNIGKFSLRYQEACLQGENCTGDFVEKNCSSNMIIFKKIDILEQIKIYKEENCLFIEAPADEQLRASNKIIFSLLEIQR